jgi:TRAP-type C4-dicarboxylate transport system substrate-binding protein
MGNLVPSTAYPKGIAVPGRALRLLGPVAAGLVTILIAAGCSAPPGVSPAGFVEPSVRLTLGVGDGQGSYSWTLAEEFARRVDSATDGTVRVEVTRIEEEVPSWNQELARRAMAGDLDLALVAGQAWDELGISSLTALYVPFLVRDEEHLDAIATGDLADDLMAGIEGTGVTSLALLPGGMRRFVADVHPPDYPSDLAGLGVRSPRSSTVWSMIAAFGGVPDDPNGLDVAREINEGTIAVLDSMLALADVQFSAPATVGDVSPYAMALTLVANDERLDGLSAGQRQGLHDAAAETAIWAASTRPSEAEEAMSLCERSPQARVVVAETGAAKAWRAAAADVVIRLRADPELDALAARIEALGEVVEPAPTVRACDGSEVGDPEGPTAPAVASPAPNVPKEFPEGVYRKEVTAEGLMDVGVNPGDAYNHEGVWMMTIRDGRYGPEDDQECPGSTYEIVGQRIVVTLGPEGPACGEAAGKVLFAAGWQLDGDQLMLTDVRSGHGADLLIAGLFGTTPWTKLE